MNALPILWLVLAAQPALPVFAENDYVADPDRVLAPGVEAELEDLADTARIGGKGGLAVWLMADAHSEPIEKLAQRAFNHGAVGHAENADAALLVLAAKQKKCAVVVGGNLSSAEAISVRDTLCASLEKQLEQSVTAAAREGTRRLLHLVRKEAEEPPPTLPTAVPATPAVLPTVVPGEPVVDTAPAVAPRAATTLERWFGYTVMGAMAVVPLLFGIFGGWLALKFNKASSRRR